MYVWSRYILSAINLGPPYLVGWHRISPSAGYLLCLIIIIIIKKGW